jgi:hypothetical protein
MMASSAISGYPNTSIDPAGPLGPESQRAGSLVDGQTGWKATASKVWRIASGADLGCHMFRTCTTSILLLGGMKFIAIQCAIGHPVFGIAVGLLGVAGTLVASNVVSHGMVSLASRMTGLTFHELLTPPTTEEWEQARR